jgi:hypothetical protein
MRRLVAASILLILHLPCSGQKAGHRTPEGPTATVEVLAFEATKGRFLGPPQVRAFESDDQPNLASRFRNGVASDIPHGLYRIEARLPGYFSDVRYVRVYQSKVTIVLGLRFDYELPKLPPTLHGRVVGLTAAARAKTFVKLVGVYESLSIESQIDQNGRFILGGLTPGLFLLFVAGENGILASRTLTVPYSGPQLEIEVSSGQVVPQK